MEIVKKASYGWGLFFQENEDITEVFKKASDLNNEIEDEKKRKAGADKLRVFCSFYPDWRSFWDVPTTEKCLAVAYYFHLITKTKLQWNRYYTYLLCETDWLDEKELTPKMRVAARQEGFTYRLCLLCPRNSDTPKTPRGKASKPAEQPVTAQQPAAAQQPTTEQMMSVPARLLAPIHEYYMEFITNPNN